MSFQGKLFVAAMFSGLMFCSAAPASAQQAQSEAKPAAKKAPAKPRGRLPVYYNQVVTPDQREKIYAIQSTYDDRIEALQAQLKDLQDKMNGEIKAILTPEQLKKVDELAAATQEKIKAARAAGAAGSGDKPTDAAPAKTAAPASNKK